jgi:superfamily II DNA/RNA helicase
MLERLNPSEKFPQCICLAPTFELALQIGDVCQKMIKYMSDVKCRVLVKGEIRELFPRESL